MNLLSGVACLLVIGAMGRGPQAQTLFGQAIWKAESNRAHGAFGSAVSAAGDVNGDGYGDILVGAYVYDGAGSASVFHGSKYGPSKAPDWTAEGARDYDNFGESVAGAGDVNGDGYDDVIVGAPQGRRASAYLGSAAGLAASPAWSIRDPAYYFGWSVAGAGDVNGDGFDDVLVSLFSGEGYVHLYLGSPVGLKTTPAWIVEGEESTSFGAWVSTAGDVNGDGFDDVIVGAPRWGSGGRAFVFLGSADGLETSASWSASGPSGSLFGYWVAPAGDVNGDAYADVIVSVNSLSNGQGAEGGFFVYQGSPTGLGPSPVWTTESNQQSALAGAASSGDLDGDGYSDVIVGYYAFDLPHGEPEGGLQQHGQSNEGRVFAFFGSPLGLQVRPGWSAASDQRDSMFGYALSGAGDVNGDGLDDVLVGAYRFDGGLQDEGGAFAYPGSRRHRVR